MILQNLIQHPLAIAHIRKNAHLLTTCCQCYARPILIKKYRLCSPCYQRHLRNSEGKPTLPGSFYDDIKTLSKEGHVGIQGIAQKHGVGESTVRSAHKKINGTGRVWKDRLEETKKKLSIKHGPEFFKDIELLDTMQYWSLSDVGRKYNISREYVRQLYKKIYGRGFRDVSKIKTVERTVVMFTPPYNDPRHKEATYKTGYMGHAAKTERMFYDECVKRGFEVELSEKRCVDIVINGKNVDVKSCENPTLAKGQVVKKFRFTSGSEEQISITDLFACYHETQESFFIIPNRWKKSGRKHLSIYINERPSTYRGAKNNAYEYMDAWHLLEK